MATAGPAGPVLDLQQVSDLDPTAQDVRAWAAARGRRVRVRAQAETIRRTFGPEDGRESKNRRTKDRKTLKRLGELGTVEVCGELLPDPTDCGATDALLAELRAVDAAHPNADHRNQPWTGTTGDLLALFLRTADPASRWLTGVRLDGRLVAYSFQLVTDRVVATYLCSYRREVAEVGVGTLLLHDVRRRAYAHGAGVLDLLRGLEPYKFRLATSTHVSRRIVVLPDARLRWTALGAALTWRQDLRPHVLRVRAWRSRSGRGASGPADERGVGRRRARVRAPAEQPSVGVVVPDLVVDLVDHADGVHPADEVHDEPRVVPTPAPRRGRDGPLVDREGFPARAAREGGDLVQPAGRRPAPAPPLGGGQRFGLMSYTSTPTTSTTSSPG